MKLTLSDYVIGQSLTHLKFINDVDKMGRTVAVLTTMLADSNAVRAEIVRQLKQSMENEKHGKFLKEWMDTEVDFPELDL
jgi:hypothetical protein